MSSLPSVLNPNDIHQGPGSLWFNVPVPATGERIILAANGSPATGAVWVLNTDYLAGQQVVDSAGNLQRAVNSGTTGATAPTWATAIGGTVVDATVTWECISLGAPYYAGAIEGATTPMVAPKIEAIMADQVVGAIDTALTEMTASIEVTMKETDMLKMANFFTGGIYGAGTDTGQPSGAQSYQQITFGGLLVVPKLSCAVISPRRNNAGKFVVSQLYRCYQAEQIGLPITRTKETMLKMKFSGLLDATRPQGDQAGMVWWQV